MPVSIRSTMIRFAPILFLALCSATWARAVLQEEVESLNGRSGRRVFSCVLEGFVLAPVGLPVAEAVVTSSSGGRAVTDPEGRYHLEVRLSLEAGRIEVTAVGPGGSNRVARTSVSLAGSSGRIWVDPLRLGPGGPCLPGWETPFDGQGMDRGVRALVVFDDGSGPELYAGGEFTVAGGTQANRVARWNGSRWEAVGGGTKNTVNALAVYDDGSGPKLYAGGFFVSAEGSNAFFMAQWDGQSWSPVGIGMDSPVHALTVFDDGKGPALYAGGDFRFAGGVNTSRVARWDGTSWAAVGGGTNATVRALAVYDDGGGAALYAGGDFTLAGTTLTDRVARWDGVGWSSLGTGVDNTVYALAVHDDGSGRALYAGGAFATAGGVAANRIARWDDTSWAAVGGGMIGRDVRAMATYDDGRGPGLIAVGEFSHAGGTQISRIAHWDGSSWTRPGISLGTFIEVRPPRCLTVYDDGGGPSLYVGGEFLSSSVGATSRIARWDGTLWSPVGNGLNGGVRTIVMHDDGGGPALYVGGHFTFVDGQRVNQIAKWDGSSWSALGSGVSGANSDVHALASFDDGTGPALYVGGDFTTAGTVTTRGIARWDGSSWSSVGGGLTSGSDFQFVWSLLVHDDGGGPALYAAGKFLEVGGLRSPAIARWDGLRWSPLLGAETAIYALAEHDDGSGMALYAAGSFRNAGGLPARIARWDGSQWSPVGDGTIIGIQPLHSLASYDAGSGPELYLGGFIHTLNNIARWDGTEWLPAGGGLRDSIFDFVRTMAVHDDGSGPALYAGGTLTAADGLAVNNIARWNGQSWSGLRGGDNLGISTLASLDDASGSFLYAGGPFTVAEAGGGASWLATWTCRDRVRPELSCPDPIRVTDSPGSRPGEFVTFSVTATDNRDDAPHVVCSPPSGSFFPPGTTQVLCKATDDAGNQTTCRFSVTVMKKPIPAR